MGRAGSGIEARAHSIRIRLSVGGQKVAGTLTVGGKPLRPTPANMKYAARIAAEIREKLRHGTYRHADYFPAAAASASSRDSVAEVVNRWISTLATNKRSTLRGYRSAVSWWIAQFGDKPVVRLVKSDILTAIAGEPAWSGKTRNNHLSVLRQALALAVEDRILAENPAATIKAYAHQKPAPDPLTADEREAILEWFRVKRDEPVLNYFEFQFFAGTRTGEALGLMWRDVDMRAGKVRIAGGLVDGVMEDETKTSRERVVDLNSRALAALERQQKYSRLGDGRVFTDPLHHRPWQDYQAPRNSHWKPALRALGIRYRSPYCTRHTCATMMLMAGANPAYVAAQLGHSVAVLLKVYARWISGAANAAEMAKIEAEIAEFCPGNAPDKERSA